MKQSQKNYKRIVVKVGSSLMYSAEDKLDYGLIREIAAQISTLAKEGREVIVVSSGAIALGMSILKLTVRPKVLSFLQAAAAIGQHELMHVYHKFFQEENINCAQLLLTWDDFDSRTRYLNARNTILKLLELKSIPVINENDTVSTEEIKFGDNDRLSALVASLIDADILIMLSDVDGVMDDQKKVVRVIEEITPQIKGLASSSRRKTSVGGMITKIEAAKIAQDSGVPCVIANGRKKDVILSVLNEPDRHGTLFLSRKSLTAKQHWIAFGTKPKGRVTVDDGARKALINKKSLLSVGIVSCDGSFSSGDIVSVRDKQGDEIARGVVSIGRKELDGVKGCRFEKEIIHRDNIVIL